MLFGLDGVESVLLGLLVLETTSAVFLTKGFELELLDAAKVLFLVDYKTKVLIIFIGWSSRWFQPFYWVRTFSSWDSVGLWFPLFAKKSPCWPWLSPPLRLFFFLFSFIRVGAQFQWNLYWIWGGWRVGDWDGATRLALSRGVGLMSWFVEKGLSQLIVCYFYFIVLYVFFDRVLRSL